ncbi:hypothetical protein LTR91_009636 [Friedmanniomyces endolithicus]|uniref:Uncharacterized protein n=1 Tax=Friedmanniomyces endolithicus TaxID=329885 RepID=A0AAN6KKU1_9PEZI|nr:hypothetical protein LTR35_006789 [Friedmanniomyces endolithicus]KAK0296948.1 hypothetical protein LTS00_004226 [Friedmanniomyces endolithicus]KAK0315072.1 hypothetical protein LTR82_012854 [Friedmanniomyces endolithicus]KAK0907315.1 hypothetical protein LTR57_017341 [Friedmanniomyces endolithicus]KAK0983710.1 hypothetical protein LTS01_010978 [Friedmanniomyces endolithicus]
MDVVQKDREVRLMLRAEESEKAEVVLLFRFLLNREQHRFSPDSMKWRTGQAGVSNEENSRGDGADVRREDVEGIDEMAGENDEVGNGTVGEQDEEEEEGEEGEVDDAEEDDDMDVAS